MYSKRMTSHIMNLTREKREKSIKIVASPHRVVDATTKEYVKINTSST